MSSVNETWLRLILLNQSVMRAINKKHTPFGEKLHSANTQFGQSGWLMPC